jgi:excisionase family DNA binding protein
MPTRVPASPATHLEGDHDRADFSPAVMSGQAADRQNVEMSAASGDESPGVRLTAKEAARVAGVHERTIRRAIARGELAATKQARIFQIPAEALAQYQVRHRTPLPPSPLRLVEPTPGPAFALPRPLTTFLGRKQEIAAVAALLTQPEMRLLTLTGPGGTGKTRLALRVAQDLTPHVADAVAFVPLASVAEASLVPSAVAHGLGVRESGDHPITERLIGVLRNRRLLLILDNFEHLLAASPFVGELLTACPELTIVATSRTPLRLSGEQRFPVPPMTLPELTLSVTASAVTETEAVQLFLARVRAAQPAFTVDDANAGAVAAICRHLDGLPLAIELAAARIVVFPPPALLARLQRRLPLLVGGPRDAPPRLQTMRDAIAWSYDLLSAEDQALFRRLAIFAGGWTLAAAEAVAGAEIDVVRGLSALVASSLVRQDGGTDDEPRYQMLETLREFGLERLEAAREDAAIRQRHAAYFLALVERWSPDPVLPGEPRRMAAIAPDYDNVRLALTWLDESDDANAFLRLAGSLFDFWLSRGLFAEGRQWLDRALARRDRATPTVLLRALTTAGALARYQGDASAASPLSDEALLLARSVGSAGQLVTALINSGLLAYFQEHSAEAQELLEEALTTARDLPDEDPTKRHVTGVICTNLGLVAFAQGQLERAASWCDEAVAILRATDYPWALGHALTALGGIAYLRGDLSKAASLFGEAVELAWAIPDPRKLAMALLGVAGVTAARGRVDTGARLLGAAEAISQHAGAPFAPSDRPVYDRVVAALTAALGEVRLGELRQAGHALSMESAASTSREAIQSALTEAAARRARAPSSLTTREIAVLRFLALARTDQEIADALFISRRTVNGHVARILAKLEVPTRRAAVERARHLGLVLA